MGVARAMGSKALRARSLDVRLLTTRAMKYSSSVTSSRRKTRKAHFSAPSSERRKLMSAPLASELKAEYGANAVPIRVNDEVRVTRGKYKNREGKVCQVYRKKWVIHITNITRDKVNGTFATRSRRGGGGSSPRVMKALEGWGSRRGRARARAEEEREEGGRWMTREAYGWRRETQRARDDRIDSPVS